MYKLLGAAVAILAYIKITTPFHPYLDPSKDHVVVDGTIRSPILRTIQAWVLGTSALAYYYFYSPTASWNIGDIVSLSVSLSGSLIRTGPCEA